MSPLVATKEGVIAAVAFAFLAGSAAVFVARWLGEVWARFAADDVDPFDDPKNWH